MEFLRALISPTMKRRIRVGLGGAIVALLLIVTYWQYWEWAYWRGCVMRNAAAQGDSTTVQASLNSGVHPDSESLRGETALAFAASSGHKDIVRLLLDKGANPNNATGMAAGAGQTDILAMLLAKGADISGETGASLLGDAVESGHLSTVNLLLGHGVDVNARDAEKMTPILHAAQRSTWEIYSTLLKRGADITARSSDGRTALMFAAGTGNGAICRDLIQRGAEVNAYDVEGKTALIYTVYFIRGDTESETIRDHMAILKLLISSGADTKIQDRYGRTALSYATEFRISKAKALLRTIGAD